MKLTRLDNTNNNISGTTFGIPYGKGEMTSEKLETLRLFASGKQLTSEIIPSAYWPDKSIKWAAVMAKIDSHEQLEILATESTSDNQIKLEETAELITVDNSIMKVELSKTSDAIIEKLTYEQLGKVLGGQRLVAKAGEKELSYIKTSIEIENKTSVRVVIKISFDILEKEARIFKNDVRLYIYLNSEEIKYTNTLFVDEGTSSVTVTDIGIQTVAYLKEESSFNKFARFSLQDGTYTEPFMSLATRRFMKQNMYYTRQLKAINQDIDNMPEQLIEHANTNATWHNYLLKHNNSQVYNLSKSTNHNLQSVQIDEGFKSNGGFAISDGNTDITIVPTNFWEKYPSASEVEDLGLNQTKMTYWFNHNQPMVFDHYSEKHHFNCYEGFEFIKSSAIGIANTSEFYLSITSTRTNAEFYNYCDDKQKAHILIADEAVYRESLAAGVYGKRRDQLSEDFVYEQAADKMLDFYNLEVAQRSWYGYWNYGDVMHTFDNHRGQWWYDSGGYAWQNTELNPNMWLWYSFLRNQDLKSYKMAYNMTRHNADTDVYHFGEYKGLGSRHNVLHYGCSCKEPRISMAHLYRIFYYLHYDERIGEIMDMVVDVDKTMDTTGPFDEFYDKVPGKTYMRIGPDWAALCSNWLVKYERFLDENALEKMQIGLKSIDQFENKLLEGPEVLFNNETYELESVGSGLNNGYHMTISFGAPQVWADYCMSFEDEKFKGYLNEFAMHYYRTSEEMAKLYNGKLTKDLFHWPEFAIGIYAFSSYANDNLEQNHQAKRKLTEFMESDRDLFIRRDITRHKQLVEYDNISTNCVAQWCLNMMQVFGYEDLIKK